MKWIKNLNVGLKLGLGFGAALAMLAAITGTAFWAVGALAQDTNRLGRQIVPRTEASGEIESTLRQMRILAYRYALADTEAQRTDVKKLFADEVEILAEAKTKYESKIIAQDDRERFEKLAAASDQLQVEKDKLFALADAGKSSEAMRQLEGPIRDLYVETIVPLSEDTVAYNEKRAATVTGQADATIAQARTIIATISIVAFLVATIVAIALTRVIVGSVKTAMNRMQSLASICLPNLATAAEAMAKGDLTTEVTTGSKLIDVDSKDEFGQLFTDINEVITKTQSTVGSFDQAQANLRELVGKVRARAATVAHTSQELSEASTQTATASQEIAQTIEQVTNATTESAQTTQQIASGSEQLATSATEAAHAVELLSSAIETVRSSAEQQTEAAGQAALVATEGSKAVGNTLTSMERIKDQVGASAQAVQELGAKQEQIGAIVKTIDDIAEQTNLLALNAAIEAARAGEHGRGFAVVADEVRKLAERSGSATKEIAELIESVRQGVEEAIRRMDASSEEVVAGNAASQEAREALKQILAAAEQSQALAVASSAQVAEMVGNAETVNQAISNVASVSEETAAGAEQMSASAEEISASAQQVAASVQEQTASVEEVSAMAQSLAQISDELTELVNQFKTERDGRSDALHLRLAA